MFPSPGALSTLANARRGLSPCQLCHPGYIDIYRSHAPPYTYIYKDEVRFGMRYIEDAPDGRLYSTQDHSRT